VAPYILKSGGFALGSHMMRGWVGTRAGLDAVARRMNHSRWWEWITDHPASGVVAMLS